MGPPGHMPCGALLTNNAWRLPLASRPSVPNTPRAFVHRGVGWEIKKLSKTLRQQRLRLLRSVVGPGGAARPEGPERPPGARPKLTQTRAWLGLSQFLDRQKFFPAPSG